MDGGAVAVLVLHHYLYGVVRHTAFVYARYLLARAVLDDHAHIAARRDIVPPVHQCFHILLGQHRVFHLLIHDILVVLVHKPVLALVRLILRLQRARARLIFAVPVLLRLARLPRLDAHLRRVFHNVIQVHRCAVPVRVLHLYMDDIIARLRKVDALVCNVIAVFVIDYHFPRRQRVVLVIGEFIPVVDKVFCALFIQHSPRLRRPHQFIVDIAVQLAAAVRVRLYLIRFQRLAALAAARLFRPYHHLRRVCGGQPSARKVCAVQLNGRALAVCIVRAAVVLGLYDKLSIRAGRDGRVTALREVQRHAGRAVGIAVRIRLAEKFCKFYRRAHCNAVDVKLHISVRRIAG